MNAPFKYPKRQEYRVAGLQRLINGDITPSGGQHAVTVNKCLCGTELEVAPISFGTKSEPDFDCMQSPVGWNPGEITIPEINVYNISNAIVHGETGLVTVGDILIRESLKLPSYEYFDIRWIGHELMSLPQGEPVFTVGRGAHLFCGYPGTRNYAHFVMDIVTSALVPPLSDAYADATMIMPQLFKSYQYSYMRYFPELFSHSIFLKNHTQVFCHDLKISSFSATNQHHFPHPYHADVMRLLRDRMLVENSNLAGDLPQKIYINRLDTMARRLANEEEVIKCVEAHGFTSISLSGLSLAQQAALFSNATHVIAPHGAGETNVLFCKPGTKLLELLLDKYVQWSMRRINSLVPIVYGCVIGREDGNEQHTWKRTWTIDIDQVCSATKEMLLH